MNRGLVLRANGAAGERGDRAKRRPHGADDVKCSEGKKEEFGDCAKGLGNLDLQSACPRGLWRLRAKAGAWLGRREGDYPTALPAPGRRT